MIISDASIDALRTGLQTTFDQAYAEFGADTFTDRLATTVDSMDASETYSWLSDFPDVREWAGDRVFKDMKETGYQIVNQDWESTVSVRRPVIMDDKIGTVTPRIRQMAQAAARHPEKLVASLMANGEAQLCFDGQNYFDIDHPVYANADGTGAVTTFSNYDDGGAAPGPAWYLLDTSMVLKPFIWQSRMAPEFETLSNPTTSSSTFISNLILYGIYLRGSAGYGFWQTAYKSKAPLDAANFEAAKLAMMEFRKDGMNPMGIMPNILVVPPKLHAAGKRVVNVMNDAAGASNPNYQEAELLTVRWLA